MSTKKSEGGDPPSIRGMVRDLVDLGIAAVRRSPSFSVFSDAWDARRASSDAGEGAPPTAKAEPPVWTESPEIGLDRSMMVEALVIDGQICLLIPPNEIVFGFMACEISTPPGKDVDGCDLDVQSADAVDSQGIQSSMCVPLIKTGLSGHLCKLEHRILIGPQDYIGLRYGQSLPHGTKLVGFALGAIHPSKMGGVRRDSGRWPASFGRD